MNLTLKRMFALLSSICLMMSCFVLATAEESGMESLPVKDMGGRVFHFGWGSPIDHEVYEPWMLEIEKKYNCVIEFGNPGDANAIAVSIKGETPLADIIEVSEENFYKFVQQGLLLDLNAMENFYPTDTRYYWKSVTNGTTVDGKIYGVSDGLGLWRTLLLYNKDIINGEDDLQLLADKGELTWDKLAEVLQKVGNSGKKPLAGQMYDSNILEAFIAANGGAIYERDGLSFRCVYDSVNTRNAITYVQDLYRNNCIFSNTGNYMYPQTQFARGKVGAYIASDWNIQFIYEKAKFDIGIVLLPLGPDTDGANAGLTQHTFNCFAIPATVENPEDVALVWSAYVKANAESGFGKSDWYEFWSDIVDDEKNMEVLSVYAKAMEEGTCTIDYKYAVTQLYDDDLFSRQEDATRALITAQAYLESVVPIYEAKAADLSQ